MNKMKASEPVARLTLMSRLHRLRESASLLVCFLFFCNTNKPLHINVTKAENADFYFTQGKVDENV